MSSPLPGSARESDAFHSRPEALSVASCIAIIDLLVRELEARFSWLLTIQTWAMYASSVGSYLAFQTKEPIIESEYQRKVKEARDQMMLLSDATEILADHYDEWADSDLVQCDELNQLLPSDAAWNRVLRQTKPEITGLVDRGVLKAKRSGKRVMLTTGSFYDWLGEPVPLPVEWGIDYEVFPDDKAEKVRRLQSAREHARSMIRRMPSEMAFDPRLRQFQKEETEGKHSWDEAAQALKTTLRANIEMRWWELRAAEIVLEEAAEEFDGEDTITPTARQTLEETKAKVLELSEKMEYFGWSLELTEPEEEALEVTRQLFQKTERRHRDLCSG
ncbi:MAG: hypothetical protein ABIH46_11990 [Chloroflexota bacterium]